MVKLRRTTEDRLPAASTATTARTYRPAARRFPAIRPVKRTVLRPDRAWRLTLPLTATSFLPDRRRTVSWIRAGSETVRRSVVP
jgi:hypothetical protein